MYKGKAKMRCKKLENAAEVMIVYEAGSMCVCVCVPYGKRVSQGAECAISREWLQ